MIAKLERRLNTSQQNKDQTQMGATINNESTTTEPTAVEVSFDIPTVNYMLSSQRRSQLLCSLLNSWVLYLYALFPHHFVPN